MTPLAYHLIWTTYGTWLPGDARGWLKKNDPGIQHPAPLREAHARQRMVEKPVLLTPNLRTIVEQTITDHCQIRNGGLHAINVRSNHIHVVVTSECDPGDVMSQFKAWSSRKLSDATGLRKTVSRGAGRRRWFTEGGKINSIKNKDYLQNAIRYVSDQQ